MDATSTEEEEVEKELTADEKLQDSIDGAIGCGDRLKAATTMMTAKREMGQFDAAIRKRLEPGLTMLSAYVLKLSREAEAAAAAADAAKAGPEAQEEDSPPAQATTSVATTAVIPARPDMDIGKWCAEVSAGEDLEDAFLVKEIDTLGELAEAVSSQQELESMVKPYGASVEVVDELWSEVARINGVEMEEKDVERANGLAEGMAASSSGPSLTARRGTASSDQDSEGAGGSGDWEEAFDRTITKMREAGGPGLCAPAGSIIVGLPHRLELIMVSSPPALVAPRDPPTIQHVLEETANGVLI